MAADKKKAHNSFRRHSKQSTAFLWRNATKETTHQDESAVGECVDGLNEKQIFDDVDEVQRRRRDRKVDQ